jgi:hypothetical protein
VEREFREEKKPFSHYLSVDFIGIKIRLYDFVEKVCYGIQMVERGLIIAIIFHNIYTIFFVICQGFCAVLTWFAGVCEGIFAGFCTNKLHHFKREPNAAIFSMFWSEYLTFLHY